MQSTCARAPTSLKPTPSAPTLTSFSLTAWKLAYARSISKRHASLEKPQETEPCRRSCWPPWLTHRTLRTDFVRGSAERCLRTQISALLEGGVDLFVLETFSDLSELQQAIQAVQELCDLPIVAQVTIQMDGNTLFGATAEVFTTQLDGMGRGCNRSQLRRRSGDCAQRDRKNANAHQS